MSNIHAAITLYQPWATWIMRQWKEIETRTHDHFKSLNKQTILIHAGMKTDDSDLAIKNPYLSKEKIIYKPDEVINGYILGSAFVYDFGRLAPSHSQRALIECSTQRWGLFLRDVKVFEQPIKVAGEMGIWYFDMDAMQKVKKPKVNTSKLF